MRYEAKHNYLKKLAQRLGNFINLSWTLASRHQQWSCYQWLSTDRVEEREEVDWGLGKWVNDIYYIGDGSNDDWCCCCYRLFDIAFISVQFISETRSEGATTRVK